MTTKKKELLFAVLSVSPSGKRYRNDILAMKFVGNYSILNELTIALPGINVTLETESFRLVLSTYLFLCALGSLITLRFLHKR